VLQRAIFSDWVLASKRFIAVSALPLAYTVKLDADPIFYSTPAFHCTVTASPVGASGAAVELHVVDGIGSVGSGIEA
jgi:hypothetical protein